MNDRATVEHRITLSVNITLLRLASYVYPSRTGHQVKTGAFKDPPDTRPLPHLSSAQPHDHCLYRPQFQYSDILVLVTIALIWVLLNSAYRLYFLEIIQHSSRYETFEKEISIGLITMIVFLGSKFLKSIPFLQIIMKNPNLTSFCDLDTLKYLAKCPI